MSKGLTVDCSERKPWEIDSWRKFPIKQAPIYENEEYVKEVEKKLTVLPGLVNPTEIEKLKVLLGEVACGKRFLLQGGDCAERFLDCHGPTIQKKLQIMLQMSLILTWGAKMPTLRIGRTAGQYGKPRSSPWETLKDGRKVMSFKGDNINSFSEDRRQHDPKRLLDGYFHASATLNHIRTLLSGGFADLRNAEHWKLDYVNSKEAREKYETVVSRIMGALEFMDTCGVPNSDEMHSVDFFTSHEGLVLNYESCQTRRVKNRYYDLSAHMVWIGDRTRQLDHAHIEFFRGIENPVGCKVGPTSDPKEIVKVVQMVNPDNEIGKMVLITRFGHDKVKDHLPPIIQAINAAKLNVIWQCDPMHGNTYKTKHSIKTRDFKSIMSEITQTLEIHAENGSHLGGVHVEMTGEDVTECVGGPEDLEDEDLKINYTSYCDPRLNYAQAMELSFKLAEKLSQNKPVIVKQASDGGAVKIDPFSLTRCASRSRLNKYNKLMGSPRNDPSGVASIKAAAKTQAT